MLKEYPGENHPKRKEPEAGGYLTVLIMTMRDANSTRPGGKDFWKSQVLGGVQRDEDHLLLIHIEAFVTPVPKFV